MFGYVQPSEDEFLLVACDGIYDVMTNKDAIDFIRNQIKVEMGGGM
jgi:serine/threonine protein phosphatase PrpC